LAIIALLLSTALAGPVYQVPVGPRAIAMGGAFSSIADDVSAIYWNPAGLSLIGHQEIIGTHANLFGSGIKDNYFAFLLPVSEKYAAAVDWYHSGFDDGELGFGENRFDLSYSMRLRPGLSLGANLKYLTRNTALDNVDVERETGWGLDAALLVSPRSGFRIGLIAQDAFDTWIGESGGGTRPTYPRNIRVAASYDFRSWGTVALDVDGRYHLGTELRPLDPVALRAGLEKDREGSEDATYSLGLGLEYGIFRFSYAYVIPPVLDPTSHLGFSIAFNFNPSRIRIERVELDNVYASLHRTYAEIPIGTARLRNLHDEPITAKISTFNPDLMEYPTEQEVILRPKAVQDVPLTAVLSPKVMSLAGDRSIQIEVSATYRSRQLLRSDKESAKTVLFEPGAIDWSRGVDQAAAFVTPKDPAIAGVAREAAHVGAAADARAFGSKNIALAAAVFDALGTLGVVYVPDPHNPYSAMSETPRAVDTVHYPRETLGRRTGDCDDTTVLVASMLANVGVPSKIADVPGHLFMLFDSGLHERNRFSLRLDEDMYVILEDGVWIPLETTGISGGFAEAWRKGAEQYRAWEARGLIELVDVTEAQRRYPPALPAEDIQSLASLDTGRLGSSFDSDLMVLASLQDEHMAARYTGISAEPAVNTAALGELAHVYFLSGRDDEALSYLDAVLEKDPGSSAALNNKGNVHAARGDVGIAEEHYERAIQLDPEDPGIRLNLGVVLYAYGDTAGAAYHLAQGMLAAETYEKSCSLLGLRPDILGRGEPSEDEQTLSAEELRLLLKSVLDRLPTGGVADSADSLGKMPETPPSPPRRPARLRTGASRARERMVLRDYLYWKE
jgi:tetratricopeptide (TPR) repeat protein/transglutaminase-like putative cysteine protease